MSRAQVSVGSSVEAHLPGLKRQRLICRCIPNPDRDTFLHTDRDMLANVFMKINQRPATDSAGSSKASSEFSFGTNPVSPLKKALRHSINEPKVTNDQSPKNTSCQLSPQSETIIDGYTIQWPKFQIRNALFQGQSYPINNTCNADSALFALYVLYRTDLNIAEELINASEKSPYGALYKTFHLVETQGWDAARINWLLTHNRLKTSDRQTKSMFGSLDEDVFCFIKGQQRHSSTIICSRPECKGRKRTVTSTELPMW
ncbi:unnamed protein product [Didymodactylos carnosus]|uniref:Uncharacterized protein n=1 Tax=Didymodactylos carnosus TaxID=1234261 RepID=A0A814EGB1_9BILA|nr:unnamed protein product [Didymodactylos carnosus]CAF3743711.1 unnamed protein product [Didymodactylos carnosus]